MAPLRNQFLNQIKFNIPGPLFGILDSEGTFLLLKVCFPVIVIREWVFNSER